jgi:uncharacterized protein (DUF302 family)
MAYCGRESLQDGWINGLNRSEYKDFQPFILRVVLMLYSLNTKTMKTKILFLVLLSIVLGISSCQPKNNTSILSERESRFDFEQTVEQLQTNAAHLGYVVPIVHDMQANMLKAGVEVAPAKIIELCHGVRAREILTSDVDRFNMAMLPCRLAVYEKEDGLTYISWTNYEQFSQLEHGVSLDVFRQVASDYDEIIAPLIK